MLALSLDTIATIVSGKLVGPGCAIVQTAVSDSRSAAPGILFVALRGERVDGHNYAKDALQAGAEGVLCEHYIPGVEPQIVVDDCRKALAALAQFQLQRYPVSIIGITGSVGKTSCKEIMASVLARKFNVLKNEGNMNTEITLPITLFGLTADHDIAVLEMGMVAKGEIADLVAIAPPHIALITNVLPVHLERLGTIEAIASAKAEIIAGLPSDGVFLLNADDPWVETAFAQYRVSGGQAQSRSFSMSGSSTIYVTQSESLGAYGTRFSVCLEEGIVQEYTISLPGEHMVMNALPAILAGKLLGVSDEDIAYALSHLHPAKQRFNLIPVAGEVTLIDDTYNANPVSTVASLRLARDTAMTRPLYVVLGDMLELGEESLAAHQQVGRVAAEIAPAQLILRGELARDMGIEAERCGLASAKVIYVDDNASALKVLVGNLPPHAVVLVKGSRGMHMEDIIAGLEAMPK